MKNLVTVVTVTYNAEDLLEETILSVINQTYDNIEYIIIDGASTDGTVDIIKKYEDHIDYWISEPDEGIYHAMNKAIEKATGEWINFMNAGDTFYDKGTVAYVMAHKDINAELIYGDYKKKNANTIVKALDQKDWHKTMPFNHQTLFTKTTLAKEFPFNLSYKIVADHHFIMSMYHQKKYFQYLDQTLAIFAEGGFANQNTVKMCIESLKVLIEHNVSLDELYQTSWYNYLSRTEQSYHSLQKKYRDIEAFTKQSATLQENYTLLTKSLAELSAISAWRDPIGKFKAYKKLLSLYFGQKQLH
jgi:glycosyltransferase involved in cell wall biosynthesis